MNTQRLSLDLAKRTGNQQVVIAQGDAAGTTIAATIYDNGTKLAESGVTAYFMMELPDGKHYARDSATYSNGVVTYVVDESHVATVDGYTDNAYFELHKGTTIASTERFAVIVKPSAYTDHEPAEDWDSAIAVLIESAAKAITDAQTALQNASAATSSANTAAGNANSAATSANTAAGNANAAATSANTAAANATSATAAANTAAANANAAATATANVVAEAVEALSHDTGSEAAQIRVLAVELANVKDGYVVIGEACYAPASKVTVTGESARPSSATVSAERVTLS